MLEPIVSFFDKLIENFTWRRLMFLLVVLVLAALCAWMYETYTQSLRLGRIERQITLVEKLAALEPNKAITTQPDLKRSYVALQRQLLSTMSEAQAEYELLPWAKKMLAAALAWTVFALFLLFIPESYSTAKNAPGAVLFGMVSVAAPFIALAAAFPTLDPPWVNYTLYPIGHLVLLTLAIMLWQQRKQRKVAEALAKLRMAEAADA